MNQPGSQLAGHSVLYEWIQSRKGATQNNSFRVENVNQIEEASAEGFCPLIERTLERLAPGLLLQQGSQSLNDGHFCFQKR